MQLAMPADGEDAVRSFYLLGFPRSPTPKVGGGDAARGPEDSVGTQCRQVPVTFRLDPADEAPRRPGQRRRLRTRPTPLDRQGWLIIAIGVGPFHSRPCALWCCLVRCVVSHAVRFAGVAGYPKSGSFVVSMTKPRTPTWRRWSTIRPSSSLVTGGTRSQSANAAFNQEE